MIRRPPAGQAQGGELVALAMAAALMFFVGREALRTSREAPARRAPAAAVASIPDTVTPVAHTESLIVRPASAPRRAPPVERAELRRRLEIGAPGTYIGDMLADRDSLLTRWPDRTVEPVRVWIQRQASFPDWSSAYFDVAQAAFDDWGQVGIPVRFTFTVDSARADVRVNFADRVSEGNRLGMTTHRHDGGGWIVGAEILIAIHDTGGTSLPSPLVAAIARHEVGHALGLAHSRDRATIMYPESETTMITGADRATLRLLYTLPAGTVK